MPSGDRQARPGCNESIRAETKLRMRRTTTAATVLAASLAILPVPATAETTPTSYTYRVSGAEVYATTTIGRFVGTASGNNATGTWYAEVHHQSLVDWDPAAIRGGSLRMALSKPAPAYTIEATFSGGSIDKTTPGTDCTNQIYTVHGTLRNVTVTGQGSFDVTLTHYRKRILNRCTTYSATVTGSVTFGPVTAG
jgi:hypothetical protein